MIPSAVSWTDAAAVASDAFVFGYPLVLMDRMRRWMTDVPSPDPVRMHAPVNAFVHARELAGAKACTRARPHADSLRSSAWLDLAGGPIVLTVPETHGRLYVLSMVDLWTNVFASIGARATGTGSGAYAIAPPGRPTASLPAGMLPVSAPTRMVRIAGYTQVEAGESPAAAHAVQDGFALRRSSAHRTTRALAAAGSEPAAARPPPVGQVAQMDALTFFRDVSRLMRDNPPRLEDRPLVERMRRVGLLGARRDRWRPGPSLTLAFEHGAQRGLELVRAAAEAPPGEAVGDWHVRFRLGQFGTDYLSRAGAACAGLEPGPPTDELPALVRVDAEGERLTGRRRYLLRFPPGEAPPVHGFWTLTTYDDRQPLVDNPVAPYSICDWEGRMLDRDGALSIQIQHRRPGDGRAANWLPAPPGPFNVLLRLCWPLELVLERGWTPPAVARVE
jgi:hypothetical protein